MRLYLITYDVCVTDEDGPRRLRRVAHTCESRGHRVQNSVFECLLNTRELALLRARLLDIIDPTTDSLRIYTIGDRDSYVETHGVDKTLDLTQSLVF